MLLVLFGTGGVAALGIDEGDEAKAFTLFRLFVGRKHDLLDGTELLEMRLHFLLGNVQRNTTHENLTDLFLFRDLFWVDLLAFDWKDT